MNISIKGLHTELSTETRELAGEKLGTLSKLCGAAAETAMLDCEIEESIEAVRSGARFKAIGNLAVKGERYHAEAMSDTIEGAVDRVRDELARELKKARGKERSILRRGGRMVKGWLRF